MSFTTPRRLPWLLLISLSVFGIDQFTKRLVSAYVPMYASKPVIPHFLWISHWMNEGAAFSIFADSASPNTVRWALAGFASLMALGALAVMVRLASRFTLTTIALALIVGGALGNVHDRIAYGSVVDFIEVHIFTYHWPDFNVADSAVVTGVCLLLLESFLSSDKKQDAEKQA